MEDLLLWDNNFYDKKLGGQALFDRQHERGVLSNGDTLEYGGGLFIQENKGLPVVQHTGAWGGFRAVLYRFPSLKKTLVVLANCTDFANGPKFFRLIDLMIPKGKVNSKTKEVTATTIATVQLSTEQLQKYTGLFAVKGQPHLRVQSTVEKDTLVITQLWDKQSYQLIPTSSTAFYRKDFRMVRFVFDEKTGIPIIHERVEVWPTEKVDAYQSTPNLAEFTGEYYSPEVGLSYTIQVVDKQLAVFRGKEKIKTLVPVSKDVFGNHFQGYQFTRAAGKINGFLMQDRRVRNLEFIKKE